MSVNEQKLFGLIAVAQEQQQAAALILKQLEARQAELAQTIMAARSAVEAMSNAGTASAILIEKATKNAVEKGVQKSTLERISEQTRIRLDDSISPAVRALQGVAARAVDAEEAIRETVRLTGSGQPCALLPLARC